MCVITYYDSCKNRTKLLWKLKESSFSGTEKGKKDKGSGKEGT